MQETLHQGPSIPSAEEKEIKYKANINQKAPERDGLTNNLNRTREVRFKRRSGGEPNSCK